MMLIVALVLLAAAPALTNGSREKIDFKEFMKEEAKLMSNFIQEQEALVEEFGGASSPGLEEMIFTDFDSETPAKSQGGEPEENPSSSERTKPPGQGEKKEQKCTPNDKAVREEIISKLDKKLIDSCKKAFGEFFKQVDKKRPNSDILSNKGDHPRASDKVCSFKPAKKEDVEATIQKLDPKTTQPVKEPLKELKTEVKGLMASSKTVKKVGTGIVNSVIVSVISQLILGLIA